MNINTIRLTSERLMVELSEPGKMYRGSRFDWTGHVTQVILDRKHRFCALESLEPGKGTGGSGICGEFGIFTPLGFEDTVRGESFPKIGVGLLTRPDEQPYSFMRAYAIEPYPMRIRTGDQFAVFQVEPVNCRGYMTSYEKTVSLVNNVLLIEYRLKNIGERPIVTEEYSHNFIAIDDHPIGPDYKLRLPYGFNASSLPEIITSQSNEMSWRRVPSEPFYARMNDVDKGSGHRWELLHETSTVSVSEVNDFQPSSIALWGNKHAVSPEVFIGLSLGPGDERIWSRRYEFN